MYYNHITRIFYNRRQLPFFRKVTKLSPLRGSITDIDQRFLPRIDLDKKVVLPEYQVCAYTTKCYFSIRKESNFPFLYPLWKKLLQTFLSLCLEALKLMRFTQFIRNSRILFCGWILIWQAIYLLVRLPAFFYLRILNALFFP